MLVQDKNVSAGRWKKFISAKTQAVGIQCILSVDEPHIEV